MNKLELEFHNKMEEIYFRAKDEIGYRATRFKQMVDVNGGREAAIILLKSKDISYGFEELCLHNRQDLSMEALIVENIKFYSLFNKKEIKTARKKLKESGYIPKKKF
ncbi:hypothetical protein ES705_01651 [subsurface metagenome]|nr:hypothetical protein [Clostridia bacterium]